MSFKDMGVRLIRKRFSRQSELKRAPAGPVEAQSEGEDAVGNGAALKPKLSALNSCHLGQLNI